MAFQMAFAISKLSANSKLVKLLKRVLKNAASFSDPRTLKDTDSSFQLFFGHSAIILDFVATPVEVSQCHLRWSGCR